MVWAKRRDVRQNILVVGTGLGYLAVWGQSGVRVLGLQLPVLRRLQDTFDEIFLRRIGDGGEIVCIAWDIHNEATLRLVTGTRDRYVHLWSFNGKELHSNFSVRLPFTVPATVAFADNNEGDIFVFGIYSGNW
jgi:hypothetical protein